MAATFRHLVRLADAKPLRDGLAAIMHEGSGDPAAVVEVRRIALRLPSVSTTTTVPMVLDLVRCSAASGGSEVPALKFDTNAGDLPSQVVAACMPDAVTTTATIRSLADTHLMSIGGSVMASRVRMNFRTASVDMPTILSKTGGTSALEPIILNEGEGIALINRTGLGGVSRAMRARLMVRVVGTGRCYFFRFNDIASATMTGGIFSLMNGSGSGVVLEVRAIEFPPEGDSSAIPRIQLALLDGIEDSLPSNFPVEGLDLDLPHQAPIALDTRNALPTSVKCYGAGFIARKRGTWAMSDWWYNTGSIATLANQQNRGGVLRQRVPLILPVRAATTGNLSGINNTGIDGVDLWKAPERGDGIILRPGEGLGVLCGHSGNLDNSAYSSYDIVIDFTVRADARGRRVGMFYVS